TSCSTARSSKSGRPAQVGRPSWRPPSPVVLVRAAGLRLRAQQVKRAIPSTAYLTSMDRQAGGRDTRDTEMKDSTAKREQAMSIRPFTRPSFVVLAVVAGVAGVAAAVFASLAFGNGATRTVAVEPCGDRSFGH